MPTKVSRPWSNQTQKTEPESIFQKLSYRLPSTGYHYNKIYEQYWRSNHNERIILTFYAYRGKIDDTRSSRDHYYSHCYFVFGGVDLLNDDMYICLVLKCIINSNKTI
jgi:hypothetical protein